MQSSVGCQVVVFWPSSVLFRPQQPPLRVIFKHPKQGFQHARRHRWMLSCSHACPCVSSLDADAWQPRTRATSQRPGAPGSCFTGIFDFPLTPSGVQLSDARASCSVALQERTRQKHNLEFESPPKSVEAFPQQPHRIQALECRNKQNGLVRTQSVMNNTIEQEINTVILTLFPVSLS